jgi:hypothetical protein
MCLKCYLELLKGSHKVIMMCCISLIPGGGPNILQRTLFCLGACIRAFEFFLSIIYIDGTFLIGKYKGQILTTTSMDDNHKMLLLAFTLVENENTYIWYWFLECVNTQVGCWPDVCLISDRHFGIWPAIHQLKTGIRYTCSFVARCSIKMVYEAYGGNFLFSFQ